MGARLYYEEGGVVTYSEAVQLLELFQRRDYAQERPHLYVRSPRLGSWVRPKGMRILLSKEEVAILHWDTEEWESIPFKEVDYGLW